MRDRLVTVRCTCGHEWHDAIVTEHDTGAKYLDGHEECPECGAAGDELETTDLDDLDIQELRLQARGVDF